MNASFGFISQATSYGTLAMSTRVTVQVTSSLQLLPGLKMETIITGTASKDSRKIQLDHVFNVYDGFNNYQGLILLVPQETQGSQDYLQPLPTLEMP